MKQIDTSTFSFPDIIGNDFLYVDKTRFIWNLVRKKKGEYFLSRPRRFGKSLLVSTLKALFQGRRELFSGLAIDRTDYEWNAYPVIHLDFGACGVKTADELETYLNYLLDRVAKALGLELREKGASIRFENLIADAAATSAAGQVVGRHPRGRIRQAHP